ncbi:MAG: hypothetical protein WAU05_01400 [Nitrospira sp.]
MRVLFQEKKRVSSLAVGDPAASIGRPMVTVDKESMTDRPGRRSRDRQTRVVVLGKIVER